MGGIFGVCHFDDCPIASTFALRATVDKAGSPVRVAFDGRLDDRDDLISTCRERRHISATSSDAELVAASYDIFGLDFARRLLGDFAVAIVDARERRVVLARDAMGIRPLYYRRSPTSLLFASEVKALIADPDFHPQPNNQLLAELLLRQSHRRAADDSTLFAGVSQVPPAHIAIFTDAGVTLQRYWDFECRPQPGPHTFDEYAEAFREHFERAVKRRIRTEHPVAVSVSGGLDSSAIFCSAAAFAEVPLVGFTYTSRDGGTSDESLFVTELGRASGRPIAHVNAPFEGPLFHSDDIIRIVEAPMLDGQWFRGDRLMDAVRRSGARTLLTGHWGDQVLFDQAYLVDLLRRGAWRTVGRHLNEYLRWFPDAEGNEFRKQFGSDVLEHALPQWGRQTVRRATRAWHNPPPWDDWYSDSFRRQARPDVFPHAPGATALARSLYCEVRSQYHHFCLEWNAKVAASYGVDAAFPFLDRDLVEFLMGVPGTVLVRNGVPKALLREALRDVVPDLILRRRTKGDFTEDANRSTREGFAALVNLLGPDPLAVQFGYLDADKLKRGLTAAGTALEHSTTSVIGWRVTAVAALEMWLRQFIGHPETGREDMTWRKTSLVSAR